MKTFRFKAPWYLSLVFVFLVIVLSFPMTGSVSAQSSQDDLAFIMPYKITRLTFGCHADGWLVAGVYNHCAIDIANDYSDGILATTNGQVQNKGVDPYMSLFNTFIWIVGDGCYDTYMLHGIYDLVNIGDSVQMGQRIGTQASIGSSSTGPHTHLSVYNKCAGQWVDPKTILTGTNIIGNGIGAIFTIDGSVSSGRAPVNTTPNVVEAVVLQPPGEMIWHSDEDIEKVFSFEREELAIRETLVLSEENIPEQTQQNNKRTPSTNSLQLLLGRVKLWVWGILLLFLFLLLLYPPSSSWWPLSGLVIFVVLLTFLWSRNYLPTFMPQNVAASMVNIQNDRIEETRETTSNTDTFVILEVSPEKSDLNDLAVFPDLLDPMVNVVRVDPPVNISGETININYTPKMLSFSSRPPLLSGFDPATKAWFEWLQAGNLQYETLWYWHNCKLKGITANNCYFAGTNTKVPQYLIAAPPYDAVLAALTVHQLGGAPLWDSLTQKMQETKNNGPPFATSSALAMGPLQEKQWFYGNFAAFPGGTMQNYLDSMLSHSNWAVSQGVMSHNTDQQTYSHRYAGSPCIPADYSKCQYSGQFNSLMWNNYSGMGDAGYFISRQLMDSWIRFQEEYSG